jgi:hypothetical protein
LLLGLAAALALLAGVAPAGAVVARIGGQGYGITPRPEVNQESLVRSFEERRQQPGGAAAVRPFDELPSGGSQLENLEDGPVMHSATTHVIYWDGGASTQFTATTKGIVDGFFTDVAADSGLATNVFGIAGQYTDSTGHAAYSAAFGGALVDTNPYPKTGNCTAPNEEDKGPYETCLFDRQLQEQLVSFITEHGLPRGPTQLYFILLPHKVATCMGGLFKGKQACSNNFFCAYHSFISPGTAGEIIYADIPFSLLDTTFAKGCQSDGNKEVQLPNGDKGSSNEETRFADVALKYISHEYIEAATDPLVEFDTAWVDAEGLEIGDKCNSIPFTEEEEGEPGFDKHAFTPTLGGKAAEGTLFNQTISVGHYYLQSEWDNAGEACLMKPLSLGAGSFSAPSGTAGQPVVFSGTATDPYGDFEPSWSFGDGSNGAGASISHTFAAAGAYTVTMTPRDGLTGSTSAPVSHTVTIAAPPAPLASAAATSAAPLASGPTSPAVTAATANSGFASATAAVNAKTGVIKLTTSVLDPGTLSFRATFANGKFGAFSSSACKAGRIKLAGRCLPATIVYAKGARSVGGAGALTVTLRPTASALKALRRALKQKRAITVTVVMTFQSSHGGAPVTHARTVTVRPRR